MFFNGEGTLGPGAYFKQTIAANFWGWTADPDHFYGLNIEQSFHDDGGGDYLERAYIWNNTSFKISDETLFVIGEDGTRRIENLGIEPIGGDDFNFESGPVGEIANFFLEPRIDPSGIGRTVDIQFVGDTPAIEQYTQWNYDQDAQRPSTYDPTLITRFESAFDITDQLFSSGVTRFLDANNRPIIYGTNDGDILYLDRLRVAQIDHSLTAHPYLGQYASNGVVGIAGDGDDHIYGVSTNDIIYGGIGNDTIDGAGGADTMYGGSDDDIYVIDEEGDEVVELANEGKDTVESSIDYVLGDNVERLELVGSDDLIGIGNELDNVIKGNGGDNYIEGHGGVDEIRGEDGDDIIFGGDGKDQIFGGDNADAIYGDGQADNLYGQDGEDHLEGGSGGDYLDGGANADRLEGGDGNDLYRADSEDTIMDSDGSGRVHIDGYGTLTGGTRKEEDPQNEYRKGNTLYVLTGTTLTVNGGLTIEQFSNGNLGIFLETEPDDDEEETPDTSDAERRTSPIVIDLDGDGVETLGLTRHRYFDHDANNMQERTAWAGADDGFLVRDVNGNGRIDSGREMFGNHTLLKNGSLAANGFEALRDIDSNQDGKLDANDATFSQLRIWRDANSNGLTDVGELLTLEQAGIAAVRTQWQTSTFVDATGQIHGQIGSAIRTDGSNAAAADVWFQVDAAHRINVQPLVFAPDLVDLPEAKGFGNLVDLRQAMASDAVLKGLVQNFASATDPVARDAMLEGLIFQWAGVANVDPKSRDPRIVYGHVMDARQLIVLEQLVGRGYEGTWCWGEKDPNPHGAAAPLLIAEFKEFQKYVRAQLLAQIDPIGYSFIEGGFGSGYSSVKIDWVAFKQVASALRTAGDVGKLTEIIGVMRDLGAYSPLFRTRTAQVFADLQATYPDLAPLFNTASLIGTIGNDSLFGKSQGEVIVADKGDDSVFGGGGNDSYYYRVGDGKDRIYDSSGVDQLVFMEGIAASNIAITRDLTSILVIVTVGSVVGEVRIDNVFDENGHLREGVIETIKFQNGTVWGLQDILSRIVLPVTQGDDVLYGSTIADTISAQGGNDYLLGLDGNDQLNGEAGNDIIVGGNGNDVLSGGTGNDQLNGGAGNDTYVFAAGFGQDVIENYDDQVQRLDKIVFETGIVAADVTVSRVGNDLLLSLAGGNSVRVRGHFNGEGNSSYSIDSIQFFDGTVWTKELIKALVLVGTTGNDIINGFSSNDTLYADAGDDYVLGGAGNDYLTGGAGNDQLDGGSGNDTYHFSSGFGNDIINNYDSSLGRIDKIIFGTGITADMILVRREDDDLIISANADDFIRIVNHYLNDGNSTYSINEIWFSDGTVWDAESIKLSALVGTSEYDALTGYTSNDIIRGLDGNDIIRGEEGNDQLFGDSGTDYLYGNIGDDELDGGLSDDWLDGGEGNDILIGAAGNDQLIGSAGDDVMLGGEGDDQLYGGQGVDQLWGGLGMDRLSGGEGDDDYYFARGDGKDSIYDIEGKTTIYLSDLSLTEIRFKREGTLLIARFDSSIGDEIRIENVFDYATGLARIGLSIGTSSGQLWEITPAALDLEVLKASSGDDIISGNSLANLMNGLAGNDTLNGREGNDQIAGDEGNDLLFGDSGDDALTGGNGNDYMDGGVGADQMSGGNGDDLYLVDNFLDTAIESANEGIDAIKSSVSFTITSNVERLELVGWDAINATGNGEDNILVGNSANNIIEGLAGNDTLYGGYGTDQLIGGSGDDSYQVDDASDVVLETESNGNDTIYAWSNYTMPTNVETLVLIQSGSAFNGTGSVGSQSIFGNDYNNRLDGGAGADTLTGGLGNDTYVVDNAGDIVVERADEGTDTVLSKVNYVLGTALENLTLQGGANLQGIGNDQNNVMTGNTGNNRLEGGGGLDKLYGGAGNDYFVLESSEDRVFENYGEGSDTIERRFENNAILTSNIENLVLGAGMVFGKGNELDNIVTGNAADNRLTGFDGSDRLFGLEGDDILDGSEGVDHLDGGSGNDIYIVDDIDDVVVEISGGGIDTVQATESYALSDNVENLSLLGSEIIDATGNALANYIVGNDANNILIGLAGDDTLQGGAGNDTLLGGEGNDSYVYGGGQDTVNNAGGGNDGLFFKSQINVNRLNFSRESDDLIITVDADPNSTVRITNHFLGGDSAIDYVQPDGGAVLTADQINLRVSNPGFDQVQDGTALQDVLSGTSGKDLIRGFAGNDTLSGMGGDDTLQGGDGDDTLQGNAGSDSLQGGAGDDSYFVDSAGDTIIELQSQGYDSVSSGVSYTLSQHVEKLTLTGTLEINATGSAGDDMLIGNSAINTLTGNNGNDILDGKGGADILIGGAGNDIYVVDIAGDMIQEAAGEGIDTVQVRLDWTLGENVENLEVVATWNVAGTGNALDNVLKGNAGINALNGLAGNDTLEGFANNDKLDGGAGNDTLKGGLGDDTYIVDSVGDVVVELAAEGNDLVNASVAYTLASEVEKLTLTGISAINGTGNAAANVLTGNAGSNTLLGLAGDDTLDGLAGNDTLDGGLGNDTLKGGAGDDIYIVDSAGDAIKEVAAEGSDLVKASVTYTLGGEVENLTLTGASAINGTGNAIANTLIGNDSGNVLSGLGGNDTLFGFAGNDTLDGNSGADVLKGGAGDDIYVVDDVGDAVTELAAEGADLVNASVTYTLNADVEKLTLTGGSLINGTGNAAANTLTGNDKTNTLSGLAGNDVLEGKGGNDTLTGGVGNDAYLMARAYGSDTVVENDATAGNADFARFLTGFAHDQLWFKRPANSSNLEISIIGTADKLVIKDWYLGGQYQVEQIRTDDGSKVLNASAVQTLVNAMAAMTPPALGQTTLTASQRTTLNPVLASTWGNQPASAQRVSSVSLAMSVGDAEASPLDVQRTPLMAGGSRPSRHLSETYEAYENNMADARDYRGLMFFESRKNPYADFDSWRADLQSEVSGADLFEGYGMPAMTGGKTVASLCGLSESRKAATIADCSRLIEVMATADRFDRPAYAAQSHLGSRVDYLIP